MAPDSPLIIPPQAAARQGGSSRSFAARTQRAGGVGREAAGADSGLRGPRAPQRPALPGREPSAGRPPRRAGRREPVLPGADCKQGQSGRAQAGEWN